MSTYPKFSVRDDQKNNQISASSIALSGRLNVNGICALNGGFALNDSTGYQSVAVPAAGAAATASRILANATVVTLLPDNNANDRAYLPSPTDVPDGKVFFVVTAATGCELSAEGDGTTATTINGTAVTNAAGAYAAELALAAASTTIVIKTGANAYTTSDGGTPDA